MQRLDKQVHIFSKTIPPQDPKQRKNYSNLHLAQLQEVNKEQMSAGSKFDSKFKKKKNTLVLKKGKI